jgi:hypothetical protein
VYKRQVTKVIEEANAMGITDRQDIVDIVRGFNVKDKENLDSAFNLYSRVFSEEDPTVSASTISRLVNNNDYTTAINNVENFRLKQVDTNLDGTNTYNLIFKRAGELKDDLAEIDPDMLGPFDGRVFPVTKGIFGNEEKYVKTQRFAGKLAQLVAAMRNRLSGTAVTETEAAFLEPLIAGLEDQPAIVGAKIDVMKEGAKDEINNFRNSAGIPKLKKDSQVLDYGERKSLYERNKEEDLITFNLQDTGEQAKFTEIQNKIEELIDEELTDDEIEAELIRLGIDPNQFL